MIFRIEKHLLLSQDSLSSTFARRVAPGINSNSFTQRIDSMACLFRFSTISSFPPTMSNVGAEFPGILIYPLFFTPEEIHQQGGKVRSIPKARHLAIAAAMAAAAAAMGEKNQSCGNPLFSRSVVIRLQFLDLSRH